MIFKVKKFVFQNALEKSNILYPFRETFLDLEVGSTAGQETGSHKTHTEKTT